MATIKAPNKALPIPAGITLQKAIIAHRKISTGQVRLKMIPAPPGNAAITAPVARAPHELKGDSQRETRWMVLGRVLQPFQRFKDLCFSCDCRLALFLFFLDDFFRRVGDELLV